MSADSRVVAETARARRSLASPSFSCVLEGVGCVRNSPQQNIKGSDESLPLKVSKDLLFLPHLLLQSQPVCGTGTIPFWDGEPTMWKEMESLSQFERETLS